MRLSAEELYQRGVEDGNRQRFARARRNLRLAAERADTDNLRARINGTLSHVLGRLGEGEEAQRLCREALDLPGTTRETHTIVLGQLGTLLMHAGNSDEAILTLGAAVDGLIGEPTAEANLRVNRAMAFMQQQRLAESAADLRRAIALFDEAGDGTGAAQARHNLGYTALLSGDIVLALREMNAAREELAEVSPAVTAISDLDRSEALREAGLVVEAEETLERVARAFGAQRMPQARAEAELQLARSLLAHDPPRAEKVARAAARRFRRAGADAWAARAEAIRLRSRFAVGGSGATAAEPEVAAVEADLRRGGFRSEAKALRFAYGAARSRAGDPPERLPRLAADDPLAVRMLAHEARAARATALGRGAQARRHAAAGLRELSAWQRSFGSIELLSSVAVHGTGLVYEGFMSAVRTGKPEVIFEWSERARHFSQQVTPVRPPREPGFAADLAQLRMLRAELSSSDWTTDPRVTELRRRVSERQWVGTAGAEGPPRVGLDELRAALDDETAFITFTYAPGQLGCLVVPAASAGAPTLIRLPWPRIRTLRGGLRADLDASAAVRGGPAGRAVKAGLDARLAELSRLLLEPALAAASDPRRVVVTAAGALSGIPWGMLPAMRGRVLTLARSASRWMSNRSRPLELRSAGFAVGPNVPRGTEEAEAAAAAWWFEAERREAGSGDRSVRVLAQGRARTADVAALAEEVDVLHLVAHGRHAALSPLLSGLDLEDGPLFGYDIDLIRRPPAVVVLSACELGRSSVHWSEEAVGMTRTWLHAGTRCVVAAPVTVADDVACELLGAMHEGLAARLDPAEALAEAAAETGLVTPFLCHGSGF